MTLLRFLAVLFAIACSSAHADSFVVQSNGQALQRPTYAFVPPAVAKLGTTIGRANVGAACDCATKIVSGSTTYCALAGALPVQLAVCVPAPSAFSKIADEGASFTITAPAGKGYTVRYGADPKWIARDLPPGTYTCDNSTFTDPWVGVGKHCEQGAAQVSIGPAQPPNVPPVPPMMHSGVQGILWANPIIASYDGQGFMSGTDLVMLSAPGDPQYPAALPSVADPTKWEQDGAMRTACKASHHNNDDGIVSPGKPGVAHDHTFFAPGTDASLTDANVRAPGSRSTCRGGTIDLTRRWVPSMFDTVTMRGIVPHLLLMYYKTGNCTYNPECSGSTPFLASTLLDVNWVPKGLHLIAGDPMATAPTGVTRFACMQQSGTARVEDDVIPQCLAGEALWMMVHLPNCLAVNADGTPKLDSPDHKSHASYMESWPQWTSPVQGKQFHCPADHPYEIVQIDFKVIFEISAGMDTSKWNLSCGSVYCGHADWFDGWDDTVMLPTSTKCLQERRDCGMFQTSTGQTALEFQGN